VLRDAGLVEARVDAQRRLYRVRAEPLRQIDEWIAPYRALWTSSLDALERHLDDMGDMDDMQHTPAPKGERRRERPTAADR
jgi:hypothetical protein